MSEIAIPGYEGSYNISPDGYIRALQRTVLYKNGRKQKFLERILSARDNGNGYKYVDLCRHNEKNRWYVHKLMPLYLSPTQKTKKRLTI